MAKYRQGTEADTQVCFLREQLEFIKNTKKTDNKFNGKYLRA